ncbi:MAG: Cof-type HAD-IIB family hydrolase [Candidatus Izemoplasmataceae bacterium]
MKPQTIVFFDIDHTIYDPIKKEVPISTQLAFKKLKARKDVLIAIATGRAFYMLDVIECLKPYIDIYITINGQLILYDNVIIHEEAMKDDAIIKVLKVLKENDLVYGYYGKDTQLISDLSPYAITMYEKANMPIPKTIEAVEKNLAIYQLWAFSPKHTTKKIQDALSDFLVVPWLSDGFDILMPSKTKKEGVQFVLDYFSLDVNQAVCFGDSDNDLEMLQYIPCSIAMGNSKAHIKRIAKHVTQSYDQQGIYNALVKLDLIKE